MNQRIEVHSFVKKDGRVLFLKVGGGQEGEPGKYELPGGRVGRNEQPEEATKRMLREKANLDVQSLYLSDVFTYTDQSDDRAAQRAIIVYTAHTLGGKDTVQVDQSHSKYAWKKLSDIHQDEVTELTHLLITMHQDRPDVTTSLDRVKIQSDVNYATKVRGEMTIYSDGGSRGNPGPSAAGYVIKDEAGRLAYEGGAYLGITTNNQAEYHGVRLGLEKAKELGAKSVDYYVDSMLVMNQLNGQYVIRNRELWPIHERIKELIGQFDKVTFRHVKREFNQQADGMVNKILDARAKKEDVKI